MGVSGGTVVSGGTLEVSANGSQGGSPAALGTGTVSIASGGHVKYWLSLGSSNSVANPFTLSGGLAGSGNILFTQSGGTGSWAAPTYVLAGTGANTGTVRVNGSSGGVATKLQVANVDALQSATLDLAAADTGAVEFTVAGNNTDNVGGLAGDRNLAYGSNVLSIGGNGQATTYSGNLSRSGLFTKVGSGAFTLSGSNATTGGVDLNAGVLALGSANALGSTGTISFNGGTLQYSASNTSDYSGRFSTASHQQYRIDTDGQSVTLASNLASEK